MVTKVICMSYSLDLQNHHFVPRGKGGSKHKFCALHKLPVLASYLTMLASWKNNSYYVSKKKEEVELDCRVLTSNNKTTIPLKRKPTADLGYLYFFQAIIPSLRT